MKDKSIFIFAAPFQHLCRAFEEKILKDCEGGAEVGRVIFDFS